MPGVSIGIGVKAGDLAQAAEGFKRLGLDAAEAGAKVAALGTGAKEGTGKIEAATLAAAAAMNRLGQSAESGSARAGKAAEQAAFRVEELRREIESAKQAGGPVSEDAVATLRKLEGALESNIAKVAHFKNVQDDVRDSVLKNRSETDLARGSINDLGDVVERMGPKWADLLGKVSGSVGAFTAAYMATRKLIDGLKEYLGVDVDGAVQRSLQGFADWVVGVDDAAGAAERMRNAQNVLRHKGIDPTGLSLAELDSKLESNSRAHAENAAKVEAAATAAAAAYKKRLEAVREWAAAELAALTPITKANSDFEAALERLAVAARQGYVTAAQALELLSKLEAGWSAAAGQKAEVPLPAFDPEPVREYGRAVGMTSAELEEAAGWISEMVVGELEGVELARDWASEAAGWAEVLELAGGMLAGFNEELGHGIVQAAQLGQNVAAAYQAWKAGGSKNGYSSEGIMGGAAIGSQVGGMGQSFGWWQGDRGQSSFGGQRSGDYGDTGAMIGGAILSYFGPIGALVGGLIGGVLGGLIKKGADEGLGELELTLSGIAMKVTKSEHGLGGLLADVGAAIDATITGLLDQLGGTLQSIPEVSFKIRDDTVTVWVGAVKGQFKELSDAAAFAVQEILRQGEISGLGPAVAQALQASAGKSLEELAADLDFAGWVDRLGLDEVALAIRDELQAFGQAMAKAAEMGLGTDQIVAELGRNLGRMRDQILGISETEEERITRQAAAFNAEVGLLRAQEAARQVDLLMQQSELRAKVELLMAEGQITAAGLELARERVMAHAEMAEIEGAILQAEGQIAAGKVGLLAAALMQLGAVEEALAASAALLESLPDLISPEEIAAAIRGAGGGGWSGPSGSAAPAGPSPEDEEEERRRRAAAAGAEARGLISDVVDGGWVTKLRAMWEASNRLRAEYEELGLSLEEVQAAEYARQKLLRDEAVGSLGLASDAIRKRYDDIGRTLRFLTEQADNLGLSAEELARITRELGDTAFLGLARSIAEAIGDQETLQELQALEWTLKLANWQLEIERLEALGLLSDTQAAKLRALLEDARNFDPTGGGDGGEGDDDGGRMAARYAALLEQQQRAAEAMAEAARRMREAIDKLIAFQRSLFLDSGLSPLTGMQRLGLAESQAQQAVAAILAMNANDPRRAEALEALPDALRSYLEELAAVYGTASGQYAAGFAWVAQVLAGLTGETIIPFPAQGGGGGGGLGSDGGRNGAAALAGDAGGTLLRFAASTPASADRSGSAGVEGRLDLVNARLERMARALEGIETAERSAANDSRRRWAGVPA